MLPVQTEPSSCHGAATAAGGNTSTKFLGAAAQPPISKRHAMKDPATGRPRPRAGILLIIVPARAVTTSVLFEQKRVEPAFLPNRGPRAVARIDHRVRGQCEQILADIAQ